MRYHVQVSQKSEVAEGTPGGTTTHAWYPEGVVQDDSVLVWAAVADGGWDVYAVAREVVEALGGDRVHVDEEADAVAEAVRALSVAGFEPKT